MNRQFLTALAVAFLAAGGPAQTPEIVAKLDARLDAERAAQRNEDVEILRRLLNKSLGLDGMVSVMLEPPTSYIGSTGVPLNLTLGGEGAKTGGLMQGIGVFPPDKRVTQVVSPFDGVYLKGAGVVYTLRIPGGAEFVYDPFTQKFGLNSTCTTCHQGITPGTNAHFVSFSHSNFRGDCNSCHTAAVPTVAAKPLTEWEQTKMAVRGEKPKEPEATKADKPRNVLCDPGTLTEQLTGQLLAHAKNVRHLGEKESITLVVTFDSLPGITPTTSTSPPTGKPGFSPDEVQKLALGDLHLKQGKYAEAAAAYADGLARFTSKEWRLDGLTRMTPEQRVQYADELQKGVRDAMRAYAKALTLADQSERAKQALTLATEFVVLEVTPTTAKPAGPAKLILSVSNADLVAKDAAAFKKAVTVERMNFPPSEKTK